MKWTQPHYLKHDLGRTRQRFMGYLGEVYRKKDFASQPCVGAARGAHNREHHQRSERLEDNIVMFQTCS
jgi:hypothetical protein